MIQPTFNFKQGGQKGPWGRRLTNWRKHMLYGGAAAVGAGAGMLMNHLDDTRPTHDLPGPRSPAFYGHRYSHVLPRGAYQAAMRHGTRQQQAAAGFVP